MKYRNALAIILLMNFVFVWSVSSQELTTAVKNSTLSRMFDVIDQKFVNDSIIIILERQKAVNDSICSLQNDNNTKRLSMADTLLTMSTSNLHIQQNEIVKAKVSIGFWKGLSIGIGLAALIEGCVIIF